MCTTYIARIIVLWTFYIYRVISKKIQQCTHLYYMFRKGMYLVLNVFERKSRIINALMVRSFCPYQRRYYLMSQSFLYILITTIL